MIKVTPDEQRKFVETNPDMFRPVKGAWRRRGNTSVYLPKTKIDRVCEALSTAWRDTVPKQFAGRKPSR